MPRETLQSADSDWVQRFLIWPLEAVAFFTLLCLFTILPRRAASCLGGAIAGFLGTRLSEQHMRGMSRNLAVAFPELGPQAKAALQRRIWQHFGRVLSHLPLAPRLRRRSDLGSLIEVEGTEYLAEAARSGRFLLVGAHFGHWELTPWHAALTGYPMSALYTPEPNPWIDHMIRWLRNRGSPGSRLIARGPSAVRQMIDSLKRGRGLFIIVDQRVNDGVWLPYFGTLAQTTTTPARLARRFDCPILIGRAILLPEGRYRLSYYEPLRPHQARDADVDILAMTQVINNTFESWIREYPEQWLCMKRRWPKSTKPAKVPSRQVTAKSEGIRARISAEVD